MGTADLRAQPRGQTSHVWARPDLVFLAIGKISAFRSFGLSVQSQCGGGGRGGVGSRIWGLWLPFIWAGEA